MFCNYQKQVWKKAFKIVKDPVSYEIWRVEKQYNEINAEINELTSFENTQRVAYLIAEMNGFENSSESYWHEAERYIQLDEAILLDRMHDLEQTVICLIIQRRL